MFKPGDLVKVTNVNILNVTLWTDITFRMLYVDVPKLAMLNSIGEIIGNYQKHSEYYIIWWPEFKGYNVWNIVGLKYFNDV